jgi:hypothetical protein
VSPCVRYRMACLLIRDAMESVPYLDEWEIGLHGARGVVVPLLALLRLQACHGKY